MNQFWWAGLTVCSLAATAPALAAAPATPTPTATPPPVSDEDMEDILKSLESEASPAPAPLPSGMPGSMGMGMPLQSMNPNISIVLDSALAAFSHRDPLQTGAHDPNTSGFNFQQLELAFFNQVDPYFQLNGNVVFTPFGVEIEEAYGTTTNLPYNLQGRAGMFLTRFGRLNPTHPHTWEFVDQPFIVGKYMGGDGNHGAGTELSWLLPVPWYAEVLGSLTDASGGATARSFFGTGNLSVRGVGDVQATSHLQQFFPLSRDLSLNWGLSAATGPNPTGRANRTDLFGTDLYLKYRPLEAGSWTVISWTAEAMARKRQVPDSVLVDYGGYTTVFWRMAQNWGTAVRYEYGSGLANDYLDPDWVSDRHRYAADLTYWPTEFSRVRWQVSMDRPTWRPEPIYSTFLNIEYVIGAHGAHRF